MTNIEPVAGVLGAGFLTYSVESIEEVGAIIELLIASDPPDCLLEESTSPTLFLKFDTISEFVSISKTWDSRRKPGFILRISGFIIIDTTRNESLGLEDEIMKFRLWWLDQLSKMDEIAINTSKGDK